MKNYGVLLSGGFADQDGYDEFWNDLVLMWKMIIKSDSNKKYNLGNKINKEFNIEDENIFVLYGDGKDFCVTGGSPNPKRDAHRHPYLEGFNREDCSFTDLPATMKNVERVFNWLKGQNDIDSLFVWTFGHGFRHGKNSWLFLADGERLYDESFASDIMDIKCKKVRIICMQQCFSGGFIDYLKDDKKNIILTACADTEFAYPTDDKHELHEEREIVYGHGEFNYYLYKSLTKSETLIKSPLMPDIRKSFMKTMKNAFDNISRSDSTPETTQYYDCFSGWCTARPRHEDFLRANWTFGNEPDDTRIEFAYPVTDIYKEEQDKTIYLLINGENKHIFKMEPEKDRYQIKYKSQKKFGLNGWFIADYCHRQICFEGYVTGKVEQPYCATKTPKDSEASEKSYTSPYSFYPQMDSEDGLFCRLVLFNWI